MATLKGNIKCKFKPAIWACAIYLYAQWGPLWPRRVKWDSLRHGKFQISCVSGQAGHCIL